jgi:hypothetical protein
MKQFLNSMFLMVAVGAASMVVAQAESSATWQPDFNDDRLLSMPDLLPLLGHFGSQWGSTEDGNEAPKSNVVELNWSGQESEALKPRGSTTYRIPINGPFRFGTSWSRAT